MDPAAFTIQAMTTAKTAMHGNDATSPQTIPGTRSWIPRPRRKPGEGRSGRPWARLSMYSSIQPYAAMLPTVGIRRIRPWTITLVAHSGSRKGSENPDPRSETIASGVIE